MAIHIGTWRGDCRDYGCKGCDTELNARRESGFTRATAHGHLVRTGHQLKGHYVPTDTAGIDRFERTCC